MGKIDNNIGGQNDSFTISKLKNFSKQKLFHGINLIRTILMKLKEHPVKDLHLPLRNDKLVAI
ncbi:hypothetical protein KKI24_20815 [bacterium]|nr:hypothetical protein [bacterium]